MSDDADRIAGLYERHARAWDAERSRGLFEKPWLDRFTAAMPRGGAVLDLGCGAGEPIARHLIDQGYRVAGVDSSPTMIALCRERFPEAEWRVADMRRLSLGRRFDGLVAWDSVFHLRHEDQRRTFPVFRDHAAPGAALLFTTGPAHGEAIGCCRGEPFHHAASPRPSIARCSRPTASRSWPTWPRIRAAAATRCGSRAARASAPAGQGAR